MKIGIDVRHLNSHIGTGGYRVLSNILSAHRSSGSRDIELIPFNKCNQPYWNNNNIGRLAGPIVADVVFKNCFLPAWTKLNDIDGYLHALPPMSFTLGKTPQLSYILDIPLQRETSSISSRIYNNIYIKQTCLRSDMILTISQDAAGDIQRIYKVPDDRLEVLYLCVDYEAIRSCPPYLVDGVESGNFILGILSRVSWRKNPKAYLETYRNLDPDRRKKTPLVLVGAVNSIDDLSEYVDKSTIDEVADHVICLGRVSDEKLIGLIKSAGVLLFPSNFEGFGLPVLEAAACGTPAITSNISVFRELFSKVSHQFHPDNYKSMADCLIALLDGDHNLCESKKPTDEWLQKFSYQNYYKNLTDVIKRVCV